MKNNLTPSAFKSISLEDIEDLNNYKIFDANNNDRG